MPHSLNDEALLKALSDSISGANKLKVAYSGGLDSTVLLHLCVRLRTQHTTLEVAALHIHHGLSQHANAWQKHCQQTCEAWSVPFVTKNINIKQKARTSLEQQARKARYEAIDALAQHDELVLLGQHQNDQAETFLLQLARGAGVEGLSAMPEHFTRNIEHDNATSYSLCFARPLLNCTQSQLIEYAQAHKLSWVEDESNSDEGFYRNFVRHSVMPVLQQKWPSINATISRSARHCAEQAELAHEYMLLLADNVIDSKGQLDIQAWQALSDVSQRAVLRFWLKARVDTMPSTAVLSEIEKLTIAKQDASPHCQWQKNRVSRYQGKLIVHKALDEHAKLGFDINVEQHFDTDGNFSHPDLPYTLHVRKTDNAFTGSILLRNLQVQSLTLSLTYGAFSRVCRLDKKRPSKSIKRWLQDMQIPPWERAHIPILSQGSQVLAVGQQPALNDECYTDENRKLDSQLSHSAQEYVLMLKPLSKQITE
jgi:tRNA(Ile)-lysidine synthase